MAQLLYQQQYFTTTLSVTGGIDASQTTGIVIQSVSGLDTTKPGIALLSYSDPLNETTAEWVEYTAINSTTKEFTGVTRGVEKGSAKAHTNGVTVAFPVSESHINRINEKLNGSDTGVTLNTPTITNPTVTTGTFTKPVINGTNPTAATYTPATGSQTVALDVSANNMHFVTGHASGTAITFTITGATNNQPFIVSITQGAVVSTIAGWFAGISWCGGSAPTLTATINKTDTFGFIRTGVNTYIGYVVGQNA